MLRTKPELDQLLHASSGPRASGGNAFWHIVSLHLLRRAAHQVPDQACDQTCDQTWDKARGLTAPDNVSAYAASAAIASIRAMRFRNMA
jgi:hypothetical protein